MADRTIRLLGKAFAPSGDVSLVVNWNNTEVFNGTVQTSTDEATNPPSTFEMLNLCSWTISTDDVGTFPLSIAVSGGTLQFIELQGNYAGYEGYLTTADDEVPGTLAGEPVVTTQPADFFGDLNENTSISDGKNNVTITNPDGDVPARDITENPEQTGEWIYTIPDGATLACDYEISASKTVTSV